MGLLMEGMRRFDEFNRALSLVPDDAQFKPTGKKATDVKEDGDPKLAKEVWGRAARGATPAAVESEIAIDSFPGPETLRTLGHGRNACPSRGRLVILNS